MKYRYFHFIDFVVTVYVDDKMYDVTYSPSSVPNLCDFLLSNTKANVFLFYLFIFLYGSEATISSYTEEKSCRFGATQG